MPDVREVYEMVTQQTPSEPGALERQRTRQTRTMRNRKVGAIAVATAIAAALAIATLALPKSDRSLRTGGDGTIRVRTTPPVGVQVVTPDGTAVVQLMAAHADDESYQLSPDGTTLAYMSLGTVHTAQPDGTDDVIVMDDRNTNTGDAVSHVAWSPDGAQLAYSRSGDIWVMNADGSDPHPITHATGDMGYYYPVWSADGTIAMWGAPDAGADGGPADSEIYTVASTGGTVSRLTHNDRSNIEPAWSPDGTRLAYWEDGELWTMGADGSDPRRLLAPRGGAWAPSWSASGDRIAFLTFVGDVPKTGACCYMQLLTVEVATGHVTRLPVHSLTDGNGPQWVGEDRILINRYD